MGQGTALCDMNVQKREYAARRQLRRTTNHDTRHTVLARLFAGRIPTAVGKDVRRLANESLAIIVVAIASAMGLPGHCAGYLD